MAIEVSSSSDYTLYRNAREIPDGSVDKTGPCGICREDIDDGRPVAVHPGAQSDDRAHHECLVQNVIAQRGRPASAPCFQCRQPVNSGSLLVGEGARLYLNSRLQALRQRKNEALKSRRKNMLWAIGTGCMFAVLGVIGVVCNEWNKRGEQVEPHPRLACALMAATCALGYQCMRFPEYTSEIRTIDDTICEIDVEISYVLSRLGGIRDDRSV